MSSVSSSESKDNIGYNPIISGFENRSGHFVDETAETNDNQPTTSTKIATLSSWAVNWFLLFVKMYVVVISGSKAVTASLVDSAVDLVSQGVLSTAQQFMRLHSPYYPVGRSRLEALSVLGCASIMIMASVEVIQFSLFDVYEGVTGHLPQLDVTFVMYALLLLGLILKAMLYLYSKQVNVTAQSDELAALIEDHFNDIMSNFVAILTAAIAFHFPVVWWLDPLGAVVISVVIIYRWALIVLEQVKKVVGYTAPPDFISKVQDIATKHHELLEVDCVRAYHFGAHFNVEMEVVLPGSMTVAESHDIALALQHKLEGLHDVERAFVHVDHLTRDGLEHKVERELVKGSYGSVSTGTTTSPLHGPLEGLRERGIRRKVSSGNLQIENVL